ncbi:RNA pyrophosphohydrolase [Rubritalea halochordaticola]|uniref:RNA pyrophosphohydrolase n=2 Tax=Rubritalea TaxID=361050 RepID=A0ABP9UZP9_9BACT
MNHRGEVLVCERKNFHGSWQFPQGGVDKGERKKEALYREVWEEVGLKKSHYKVLEKKGGYRYLYPPKIRKKKKYDGQKQTYYLCQLKKWAPSPYIGKNNPEFRDYDWVHPEDFHEEWLPDFKLEVYRQVMWDFFEVDLSTYSSMTE